MNAIPEREAWLHENEEAMAMVDRGLAEMTRGDVVSIDLSAFPPDED